MTSSASTFDVAIVGGGIVGLATAMALARTGSRSVVVLEAEHRLAAHQTGHNSGVIHSGLYYKPGSLKARLCVAAREELYRFCAERGIAHERCGKLVLAVEPRELDALEELERRGRANGLRGLTRLGPDELREREPHARGVAGLLVPETGIVDYRAVAAGFADVVREAGHEVRTACRFRGAEPRNDGLKIDTTDGMLTCRLLVNCAGLQSDRVARGCGVTPGLRIVPFRGDYYELVPERRGLVRHLIYPVPDARFPFLGVHLTRTIGGAVEAGPNAAPALHREGYGRYAFSARDALDTATYRGFWRFAGRHWKTGAAEIHRSLSKRAFLRALRRLVPALEADDIERAGAGVRAQALAPDGSLVDDFHVVEGERSIHVLNAPSPAATASIGIGRTIAERVVARLGA